MSTSRFYCCYLLTSLKPDCENQIYIGFTVHPKRRIRQHNGEIANGALKTSKKRPWHMVLCVFGFPSKRAALYFEWSWQHPEDAKGIRDRLPLIRGAGNKFRLKAKVRYLFEMLNISPWDRMPLTVHWFSDRYHSNLQGCPALPLQIASHIGPFDDIYVYKSGNYNPKEDDDNEENEDDEEPEFELVEEDGASFIFVDGETSRCAVCNEDVVDKDQEVSCPVGCSMRAHVRCLALKFLENEAQQLLPTVGQCPSCEKTIKWPELIARKRLIARRRAVKEAAEQRGLKRPREVKGEVLAGEAKKARKKAPGKAARKQGVGVEDGSVSDAPSASLEFGSFSEEEPELPAFPTMQVPILPSIREEAPRSARPRSLPRDEPAAAALAQPRRRPDLEPISGSDSASSEDLLPSFPRPTAATRSIVSSAGPVAPLRGAVLPPVRSSSASRAEPGAHAQGSQELPHVDFTQLDLSSAPLRPIPRRDAPGSQKAPLVVADLDEEQLTPTWFQPSQPTQPRR